MESQNLAYVPITSKLLVSVQMAPNLLVSPARAALRTNTWVQTNLLRFPIFNCKEAQFGLVMPVLTSLCNTTNKLMVFGNANAVKDGPQQAKILAFKTKI